MTAVNKMKTISAQKMTLTGKVHEWNNGEAGEAAEHRANANREPTPSSLQQQRGGHVGRQLDGTQQEHVEEHAAGQTAGVQRQRIVHQRVDKPAMKTHNQCTRRYSVGANSDAVHEPAV